MKRKLDETEDPEKGTKPKKTVEAKSFGELDLDPRLLQGVAAQGYRHMTPIQSTAIPLILDGRDVIAKAVTGSGKTASYLLPVLQKIITRKERGSGKDAAAPVTSSLILVPTRELADQVFKVIESLTVFCKSIQAVKLTDKLSATVQRSLLSTNPDIVIATPAGAWTNVSSGALPLEHLVHAVLDEADLVLSYGYEEDLQNVARSMPKGVQTILMSATLTPEVHTVKGLFCRNPALLDLEEPQGEGEGIVQYVVKCSEEDKFLLAYVIFKLRLIQGKVLVFTQDVDRCYKLKLFFEQFGIRSCVLNSELPVNSRIHVVEEFNKGVYDIIIASDENEALGDEEKDKGGDEEEQDNEGGEESSKTTKAAKADKKGKSKKREKPSRRDKEFGISRGIDFKNVAAVVNFDLPTSAKSYMHRIGRTGRAGQTGMSLSFVIPEDQFGKHPHSMVDSAEHDGKILARIVKQQGKLGRTVKDYQFDLDQVNRFRYRMHDALRAVTRVAVRDARLRELRQEIIKSDRLRRHFEENPQELAHLRHDDPLRAARTQAHLRHVPDYLLPDEGKKALAPEELGFVPLRKKNDRRNASRRAGGKKSSHRVFKVGRKKSDPLKSFKAKSK
ncbi:ATP-dependent RNA helicase dbp9 [Sodiomyces alkalinus F11]|uniref:RNA helicase n=1 Tax=Sodiomyces alkalinus (strain CBS 110278 / VKM F-3762 / F11) TaxID=1314773 RepID=A0A3N2PV29_SODAK|nr:ATP-dependent RNA helicase dbp9 [Sodiomyces alkalinus F11]ROT38338.1 ATP-dependent RNA helicase dbp9 [Sodiomyces alkalinus F11]